MMTEETRRAFGFDNNQLLQWRQGGRSQRAKTLLFVAGVSIMILLGFSMLSAAPLPQYGGQRMGRRQGPDQQLARMTKQLHLTDDQQAKIKPILEDQQKQMMALRQDTSMSREDRFAKFREIRKATFEKMNPILTAEQQKQLQQMQQMRRERRGPRGGNQPPEAR
jgi:Spy/CpxP family protein refolding chaperone